MARARDVLAGSFNGLATTLAANAIIERSDEVRQAQGGTGEYGCSTPAFLTGGSLLVAGSVYLGTKLSERKGPLATLALSVATLGTAAVYGIRADNEIERRKNLADARYVG